MSDKRMDSKEAERRYTSTVLCGGTVEERRFALRRWRDAMDREWTAAVRVEKRKRAKAVRG